MRKQLVDAFGFVFFFFEILYNAQIAFDEEQLICSFENGI